jgi:hypothetical protein
MNVPDGGQDFMTAAEMAEMEIAATGSGTDADTGLLVVDIDGNAGFAERTRHTRDFDAQMSALQRIAHAFVDRPESILQELVNSAVSLCRADSAGISVVRDDSTDENYYHWVATAGQYSGFLDAVLPRFPSACGICLERGRPQHFTVAKRFFDIMGIEAPLVTDGILLPWEANGTRGTIFVMAHGRTEAFDATDCGLLEILADFAAMAIRQQRQQALFVERASAAAAASMANDLAHQINNPLQSLTNMLYLVVENGSGMDKKLGQHALDDLERLSALVNQLLTLDARKLK